MGEYEVRLARSSDLMQWTFVRTLLPNADMPFLKKVTTGSGSSSDASWILLTHEQWMRPGSETPSQLGFKLYYNESQLAAGDPFNSFVAPLTPGGYPGGGQEPRCRRRGGGAARNLGNETHT
jgi:hypothetical protein